MDTVDEYLAFARVHPALFMNPPGSTFIIILDQDEIHEVEKQVSERLKDQGLPVAWAKVGIVYKDQYVCLLRDAVHFPDGSVGTCIRSVDEVESAPGVAVLPMYQRQILLIRHFRHKLRTWHLEIPQGFGIKGLSSEECAQKELEEEIGATIAYLHPLGLLYPDESWGADYIKLFYAEIEFYGDVEVQEGIAELLPIPLSEFEHMILAGEIADMFTIVAYTRAKLQGLL